VPFKVFHPLNFTRLKVFRPLIHQCRLETADSAVALSPYIFKGRISRRQQTKEEKEENFNVRIF